MSVIVKADTGAAEDLPDEQAQAALESGTHHVALNDPEGNPVTAPIHEARHLLTQGYTQPSPEQYQNLLEFGKFSTPEQQGKAFLEGMGEGATFGTSVKGETVAGVKPEDITARRKTNPGMNQLGQAAGLVGSSFLGVGEGPMLETAGKGVAKLAEMVGLGGEGAGLISRVGSGAVKDAAEMALFQSGDEAAKLFAKDPDQSAETALTDIGLSSLFGAGVGGAFGAVSPLWKAAQESKTGKFLSALKDKANGNEPPVPPLPPGSPMIQTAMPISVDTLMEKAGVTLPAELKAAIEGSPEIREKFRLLMEGATGPAQNLQARFKQFQTDVHDTVLKAFGRTPEEVNGLAGMSDHDMGQDIMEAIRHNMEDAHSPIAKEFEQIKQESAATPLSTTAKASIMDRIAEIASDAGWDLEGTPQNKLIQNVIGKWLPATNDLGKLRSVYSIINEQTEDPKLWRIGVQLNGVIRAVDDAIVESSFNAAHAVEGVGDIIPETEAQAIERALNTDPREQGISLQPKSRIGYAREAYNEVMQTAEQLNKRLRVGPYAGPESFLTQLGKMSPEEVVQRLLVRKNDKDLLDILMSAVPDAAPLVREAFKNQILKAAGAKATTPYAVNTKTLFSLLDKWSPDLRQFVLPQGAESQINASRALLEAVPGIKNTSHTAGTLDALWSKLPGSALAMISMMTGHNPVFGYFVGQGGKFVGREAPDAMNIALLRFLGSSNPVDASAFKTAVEFSHAVVQGESKVNKAVSAVFKAGRDVLPQSFYPTEKHREKIKDRITMLNEDPSSLLSVGGNTGYYMPGHGSSLAAIAMRAVTTLRSLQPDQGRLGPLDPPRELSTAEKEQYNDALDIAQQPLIVLDKVKSGTLTPQDVDVFHSIYPNLYSRIYEKIMHEVVETQHKGEDIPYDVRMSLSMFLGQPLDASLTQEAILASQPEAQQPLSQQHDTQSKHHESFKSLGKLGSMYQTPTQARMDAKNSSRG